MSKQSGFTIIELVMVIVILGILAAIAVPKFVDLQTSALNASKRGMSGAVKSSLAIAVAENKAFPDVTTLATYVQGENVVAAATGISVDIDGTAYIVPTYKDSSCTAGQETGNTTDVVRCVGTIP
jgi:MSHA pilin protein MshA